MKRTHEYNRGLFGSLQLRLATTVGPGDLPDLGVEPSWSALFVLPEARIGARGRGPGLLSMSA
ncbi:hypothetical protein [Azospirillum sp.]|uniref:hypothetical protein n=1 Tax=Azospirillum sp. TaxID=34012 RepID=UPI003D719114